MRRILVFLVLSLSLAGLYGVHSRSVAVTVNGTSISSTELNTEMSDVAHHGILQCYLGALVRNGFAPASARDAISTTAVASWVNGRVQGLTIASYVQSHYHYVPSASDLRTAQSAFEGELTQLAQQYSLSCPGTSAQALAAMPAALRRAEIAQQADSMYLLTRLKTTTPLTLANMKAYYHAHLSNFRTICISLALVPVAKVHAFEAGIRHGASLSALAHAYSTDPSAKRGGTFGCYGPTSSSYAAVVQDLKGVKLGHWSHAFVYQSGVLDVFLAPTSVTVVPFAKAAATVLADLQTANSQAASQLESQLLYYAHVKIDDSLGLWSLTSSGPTVGGLTTPATSAVNAPKLLSGSIPPNYK